MRWLGITLARLLWSTARLAALAGTTQKSLLLENQQDIGQHSLGWWLLRVPLSPLIRRLSK
jgi:hypothetical protein